MVALPSPPKAARPRPSAAALTALAVVAALASALLQSIGIGERALWLDEISTVGSLRGSWGDLVAHRVGAGHFPVYFALLKALGLAEAGEAALRLPSLGMMAAAVGLMAVTAARVGGLAAGIAGGAAAALMPVLLAYGQEARPIAMMVFGMALAVDGHVGMADGRRGARAAFAAGIALAALSILAGTLIALAFVLFVWRDRAAALRPARPSRLAVAAAVAAALAGLALLPGAAERAMERPPATVGWTLYDAITGLHQAWLFGVSRDPGLLLPPPLDGLAALLAAGLAIAGVRSLDPDRRALVRTWGAAAGLLLGVLVVGCLYTPALKARYLAGTLPMLVPLIGCGLASLWRASAAGRAVAAMAGIVAATQAGDAALADLKPEWRPAIALFGTPPPARVTVLTADPNLRREMAHYLPAGVRLTVVPLPEEASELYPLVAGLAWDEPVWVVDGDTALLRRTLRLLGPACVTRHRRFRPVVAARLDLDRLFERQADAPGPCP